MNNKSLCKKSSLKGHKYTLLVEKTTLANPPMDASNVKYKLISIVEQIPVAFLK